MPMRTHLSLVAAGVALALTGCGNDPEGAPRPAPDKTTQLQDAGARPMSAHYVGNSEWGRGGGVDVVTAGEKIRVGWSVPDDDPPTLYYWVYDGDRMLEHISDGEIPNTLYESPQQDSEMYPITQGWVLPLGGEALDSACPGGRPFGTKTIAGRTAVGYRCTSKKRRTLWDSKELWIDRRSGLVLQIGKVLQADEVTEDPPIDTGTFSTEPPAGADVRVVKATGKGPPPPPDQDEDQPVLIGTSGPDRLSGTASGDIHIEGRGGDDTLRALGKGFDYIDGGSGDDRLVGGQGMGDYMAGPGDDYVFDSGTDSSADSFAGGSGDDELIDMAGPTSMIDDAGRDTLRAGEGRDFLLLSDGADRAWAGAGDDSLQVDVDGEVDRVSCGPGDDTVQFTRREPADRYLGCEHFKVVQ